MELSFVNLIMLLLVITFIILVTVRITCEVIKNSYGVLQPNGCANDNFNNVITNQKGYNVNPLNASADSRADSRASQVPDQCPLDYQCAEARVVDNISSDSLSLDESDYLPELYSDFSILENKRELLRKEIDELKKHVDTVSVPEGVPTKDNNSFDMIYDIPEQIGNDVNDNDVEIITPEYERFMERKLNL